MITEALRRVQVASRFTGKCCDVTGKPCKAKPNDCKCWVKAGTMLTERRKREILKEGR